MITQTITMPTNIISKALLLPETVTGSYSHSVQMSPMGMVFGGRKKLVSVWGGVVGDLCVTVLFLNSLTGSD